MNTLRPRDSFCFLLVSSHFFYPNFKRPIPSQKWILKQHVRVPLNIPKHSTKISCQCTNPFTSSEPLPKRPENPSGATAVFGGRVHSGPRRDQLLDHGAMAVPSRHMQRSVASGAKDATRKAGRLRLCRRETRQ